MWMRQGGGGELTGWMWMGMESEEQVGGGYRPEGISVALEDDSMW